MDEHLTSQQVSDWRAGVTPAEEILRVDDHLAVCEKCRLRLSAADDSRIAGIQAEFLSPHLSEAELDVYAQGNALTKDAATHLEECAECRDEARDLRQFASASRKVVEFPTAAKVQWHAIAATIAIAALGFAGWLADRRSPALPMEAIGSDMARDVYATMRSGKLQFPVEIAGLAYSVRLRSPAPSSGSSPFRAISPIATAVLDGRPVFRWTSIQGATYSVAVYDDHFHEVAQSGPIKAPEWRPEKPLARGGVYRWEVIAARGAKEERAPGPADPEARFAVLDDFSAAKFVDARASIPHTPLALGILYARFGAFDDARREFESVAAQQPLAKKFLAQLDQMPAPMPMIPAQ
ncbi:MAG TPA: hypothetical protein VHC90_21735 [Bryobacteraceae bacterium]|nr:hypothetical protein [Bryobacteraceae bacterium]